MPTVRINPDQVGAVIRASTKSYPKAISQGSGLAALRAMGVLKRITPVDRGMMKNAWQLHSRWLAQGLVEYMVQNSAPYAGIIERGARPHPVSAEGWMAIFRWVLRHPELFSDQPLVHKNVAKTRRVINGAVTRTARIRRGRRTPVQQVTVAKRVPYSATVDVLTRKATEITNAIVWKLKHHGQPGHYLVAKNMNRFQKWAIQEITKQLLKVIQNPQGSK